MENTTPLNAVVLHGFMQNASSFKARMASTSRFLKKINVSCDFWNAPFILKFLDGNNLNLVPFWPEIPQKILEARNFGIFENNENDLEKLNNPQNYAFWARNRSDDSAEFVGMKESVEALKMKLEKEKVDVLIAFSQGATAVAMIIEEWTRENKEDKIPSAVILMSPYYSGRLDIAQKQLSNVMVVIGKTDQVVPVDGAVELCEKLGGVLVMHEGGHYIPNLKKEMTDFILKNTNKQN